MQFLVQIRAGGTEFLKLISASPNEVSIFLTRSWSGLTPKPTLEPPWKQTWDRWTHPWTHPMTHPWTDSWTYPWTHPRTHPWTYPRTHSGPTPGPTPRPVPAQEVYVTRGRHHNAPAPLYSAGTASLFNPHGPDSEETNCVAAASSEQEVCKLLDKFSCLWVLRSLYEEAAPADLGCVPGLANLMACMGCCVIEPSFLGHSSFGSTTHILSHTPLKLHL